MLSLATDAEQVASAAYQITTTSQAVAEGASEQAASLEETSASLEQVSSMTKQNTENATQANVLAKQARQVADAGEADMQAMAQAMLDIKTSSDDIAKIIKTIDEIAFQTNILALNAAVEAARAGEAGAGFAVVAGEVRNLAQRAAQAAKETATKIEGAIAKTGHGVALAETVTHRLHEIVDKARHVDELVAEVAAASKEQSQGVQEVNSAVTQMDKVTQSNAASAEESASAAQELQGQSHRMKEAVSTLLAFMEGAPAHAGEATAHASPRNTPPRGSATARARWGDPERTTANGISGTGEPPEPGPRGSRWRSVLRKAR